MTKIGFSSLFCAVLFTVLKIFTFNKAALELKPRPRLDGETKTIAWMLFSYERDDGKKSHFLVVTPTNDDLRLLSLSFRDLFEHPWLQYLMHET